MLLQCEILNNHPPANLTDDAVPFLELRSGVVLRLRNLSIKTDTRYALGQFLTAQEFVTKYN